MSLDLERQGYIGVTARYNIIQVYIYTHLAAYRTNFCSESLYVQLGDYLNVAGTFALYYSSECVCTVYSDAVDCLSRNQQVHTN